MIRGSRYVPIECESERRRVEGEILEIVVRSERRQSGVIFRLIWAGDQIQRPSFAVDQRRKYQRTTGEARAHRVALPAEPGHWRRDCAWGLVMRARGVLAAILIIGVFASRPEAARATDTNGNGIDDRIEMPGTQPGTSATQEYNIDMIIEPPTSCTGCHEGGTADLRRPLEAWRGTMMANAGRDPV